MDYDDGTLMVLLCEILLLHVFLQAYHFFLLAQRQLYGGQAEASMLTVSRKPRFHCTIMLPVNPSVSTAQSD